MIAEKHERHQREHEEQPHLSSKVLVMQPILRFLQLLCENHNQELQNLLRTQNNKTNYNLVSESLMFLDCICGSTTGGLGLLGLYINENNVSLINQTLETLTEYCQVSSRGKIEFKKRSNIYYVDYFINIIFFISV